MMNRKEYSVLVTTRKDKSYHSNFGTDARTAWNEFYKKARQGKHVSLHVSGYYPSGKYDNIVIGMFTDSVNGSIRVYGNNATTEIGGEPDKQKRAFHLRKVYERRTGKDSFLLLLHPAAWEYLHK